MKLKLFKTLWGHVGTLELAIDQLLAAEMQGIEAPPPETIAEQRQMADVLRDQQLDYIAEITTAGSYVPERQASLQQHLTSLESKLQACSQLEPLFVNCIGGCDAWPENLSIEFFSRAIELANQYSIAINFETHRSRSLFNPWTTQRILEQVSEMHLTADFSHWCVVCERLMDTELDVIHAIADRVRHIHARIGYDQGPQVPDPRAPEYEFALRAHQTWWEIIWREQIQQHCRITTMTPEFGPDGYLHEMPFSQAPVADCWDINRWIAQIERQHYQHFRGT